MLDLEVRENNSSSWLIFMQRNGQDQSHGLCKDNERRMPGHADK